MQRISRIVLALGAGGTALMLTACSGNAATPSPSGGQPDSLTMTQSTASAGTFAGRSFEHVCGAVLAGFARCHSVVGIFLSSGPSGYNPADLQAAYSLPSSTKGSGQTVAIVDAYNDPNAESDLAVYRSKFGLPACTTANGCFKKVDQNGGTSYPRGDRGWAEEISLDVDMVSAVCPLCHILLVEATNNSFANLAAAVDEAAKLGATEISNSYGGGEYSSETSDQSHYNHPGIAVTVSSGDGGFGIEFPAASQYVTAVGGTTLSKSRTGSFSETAWSGAGSGCSAYVSQQSWQSSVTNITKYCSKRAVADVSADADPNTGVSVYDTFHTSGWLVFGGTSVSSPIIASVYALAGNASTVTYGSYSYSHTSSLHDVTSGSNGSCGNDLCTAVAGWDGPTGNGTPNGTGGF